MKEIWKKIEGYPNYKISSFGRIKSKIILKNILNGKGYLQVNLSSNGKIKISLVHRLVANAFLKNPKEKPYINHIDNNPKNNHLSNLEWCTQRENLAHCSKQGRKIGLRGEKSPVAKLTQKEVDEIRVLYK